MKRRADVAMHDIIFARVLPVEKQAIVVAATRQGVSLSEFTRQAMTEAVQRVTLMLDVR